MKRILVTGGGGFVGSRILRQLSDRFETVGLPRGFLREADETALMDRIERACPDVILHTAAASDVRDCEEHPEESRRANVLLPLWVARAARRTGAKLLAFSSDQVYTGLEGEGPFDETARLSPANVYGRHKLEGEERVLGLLPEAVLLRATWMYDLPGYGLPIRGNLPLNLIAAALRREPVRFSPADRRGVTYVRQVVELLIPAMELPGGVYNFGSENAQDMLRTACDFRDALGLTLEITADRSLPPRSLAMDCGKLRRHGIRFDDTQAGIRRCMKDYGLAPR